ncbi:MAG TPA: Rrf2 family transcriptional regulator [Luteolibacter sp.]|nr:Rrf2 family transcriptional regulator [Luteolibacter sp.]
MFTYSKLAQAGIAAVSYLASIASEGRLAGSAEVAEARELSQKLIAKVLTILSRAGIVEGTPGPSGGYRLKRPPSQITLLDIVRVFDRVDELVMCPFGPHWCGSGDPCPLHHSIISLHEEVIGRLSAENFQQFAAVTAARKPKVGGG